MDKTGDERRRQISLLYRKSSAKERREIIKGRAIGRQMRKKLEAEILKT